MNKKKKGKPYPACCLSAHCGQLKCDGCPRKPILDAWKRDHAKLWTPSAAAHDETGHTK